MNKPSGNPPFYRNRNWLIGFIVTLAAVLLFYYLETHPAKIQNAPEPIQGKASPTAQVGAVLATPQPETGWKAGITFTAPGELPSDLLRVGEEVWIFTEEGKKLARVNLKGEVLSETALEGVCGKATWDGEAVWCTNMSAEVSKVDPETGRVLEKFETDTERIQSIAWDGESLWLLVQRGSLASYDRTGKLLDHSRVGSYGFARDLAFKEDGLWVVYIPPLLAQYDASFKLVDKTDQTCGIAKGVLDYAIDWDGESLWYVDFISGQVTQCIAVNQ
jgi:hypothetical protein